MSEMTLRNWLKRKLDEARRASEGVALVSIQLRLEFPSREIAVPFKLVEVHTDFILGHYGALDTLPVRWHYDQTAIPFTMMEGVTLI